MRLRGPKIAIISAVVFLLNLQKIVSEITLRNPMFLREIMIDDFSYECENLLFLTCLPMTTRRRQGWPTRRRTWVWPRPQNWFDTLLASRQLDIPQKPNCRMESEKFEELSRILRGDVVKQETRMRKPVSLEKRIGLQRVSTGKSYRLGGLHFDLGKSIAKVVCQEVDEAFYRKKDLFIRFNCVADEVQEVMNDFEEEYHFPQIVGAVDGCASKSMHHRETKKTTLTGNSITASTCKGYSILSNIISFPGSIYDVRVLQPVNRVQLRPMLVGDGAYPLKN